MTNPRISLNKLGEYLTATPARRRRIVLDQQNPQPFIVTRYGDAREAIVNFMSSGFLDREKLVSEARRLRIEDGGTDFSRQDREASAEAIHDFLKVVDQLKVRDSIIVRVSSSTSESMEVAGVTVSIRPDVYLKNFITGEIVGAIKLHFPKTTPLDQNASEYVATALRVFLEKEKGATAVDFKQCYVIDVSTGLVTHSPRTFTKKMNDISAACDEIDARWKRNQVAGG